MVVSGIRRAQKYAAKVVGDVVKNRIDAQKDNMIANATPAFADLATKEADIGGYIDSLGINVMLKPFYMSYGRKLYMLQNKHEGIAYENEACIATYAWERRGLDAARLVYIANAYFDVDVSACSTA
ncbi:unnamed protein product [marine sediment metagenome]|uniref:Uncharacterized protein n=1 Tax=marine sediment metagenome TaxID=412755 RepID=X1SPP3_9ZZZZ